MRCFAATQLPCGSERIELLEETSGGWFKKASARKVPREDWLRLAPQAAMGALAAVRSLDQEFAVEEEADAIILPTRLVAALNEADAHLLGLPPATHLTLQLRSTGSLADGTVDVQAKWIRRGGAPVRADPKGARVRDGASTNRMVEPLYSVLQLCRKVSEAPVGDDRRAAFAELREQLGEELASGIDTDGFIDRIRIAYAAAFSLDAKTSGGRFDFDPVLFSRKVQESVDGDLVDESEGSLLTTTDSLHFQAKFRQTNGERKSYLLPDGTLLFLDPLLTRALGVVREQQKASSDKRRDFLRSPQRFLREKLGLDTADDDAAADRLFIETQQFSERVSGIEVWQKPVLPWIKPKANSWLPESFGLRIGDPPNETFVTLETGDAEQISTAVSAALELGEGRVTWNGEEVPANTQTLAALDGIAKLEWEIAEASQQRKVSEGPTEALQTFFLQIGQNFETLDFARLAQPGSHASPYDPPALPEGVRSPPKPHQLEAFAWLTEAWSRQVPGLLLADDMGLGKTFQALMFLRWVRAEAATGRPILIVAPTGLLRNWQAEIAQHLAPGALGEIVEAFGSSLGDFRTGCGNDIHGGSSRLNVEDWNSAGVVLTTYETMRDYHMSFARIRFSVIVYDEVQKLKNPASQMTRAAKALNADMQLAMTGTPVENRLQDLWSIADTVYPGFLGTSREFEFSYPATSHERLSELQSVLVDRDGALPAFMLRRMKDEILTGLPKKSSQKYSVEMPPEQASAYDNVLARARALRQSGDKGAMLKVLHMLRGTSLHPHPPRGVQDVSAYIGQSARLKKTFELLEDVAQAGEKALVFCEDLEMQAFLAMAIQERFEMKRLPMCISGQVPGPKRQEMVSAFQSKPPGFDVMILSPKAGGVGLTITAANHVIHLSRWWNPAVEDQATDRVYRIGQERPVTVHIPLATHPDPLIASSSFDKRLDDLMERKRTLSRGLLLPPESEGDVEDLIGEVLDGRAGVPGTAETLDRAGQAAAEETAAPATAEDVTRAPSALASGNVTVPKLSAERPILSLKPTPVEAAEARAPGIRRVVFDQHGLRDWAIFNQYLENADIEQLEIQDPYCCASNEARSRLVNFVKRFSQRSIGIRQVHVVAFDADSVESYDRETTSQQRLDLERRWKSLLPDVELRLVQRSRRAGGDLHDRFVRAELASGGRVIWDLGRGIDGVMSARWSCVVNAFHEPFQARVQ